MIRNGLILSQARRPDLGKFDGARALGTRGSPGRGFPGWWAQALQAPCQRARRCATSGLYCSGCRACWLHLFPLLSASHHLRRNTGVCKAEPICAMDGGSAHCIISVCISEHDGYCFIQPGGDREQAYLALSVDGGCPLCLGSLQFCFARGCIIYARIPGSFICIRSTCREFWR